MSWLRQKLQSRSGGSSSGSLPPPPEWSAAPERSHTDGLFNEASTEDYERAERFCAAYPLERPRLLPSDDVDRIAAMGCGAWALQWPDTNHFVGHISIPADGKGSAGPANRVVTEEACTDTCILSNFPISAGLYDTHGKLGAYFEITVERMDSGAAIAIGTACRPYPAFRLPGWNRQSAALHLDDMRKFFEDPDGGCDCADIAAGALRPGDTVGCGLAFAAGAVFFTHNGARLADAFRGAHLPRAAHDVYAALGVSGRTACTVNFGAELFRWKEGNEWAWRVEGQVGRMAGGPDVDEELPSYSA